MIDFIPVSTISGTQRSSKKTERVTRAWQDERGNINDLHDIDYQLRLTLTFTPTQPRSDKAPRKPNAQAVSHHR